jgi:magnesium-transporting ATPase (P-type)
MATGDNVLTAIHVGRECGIISHDAEVIFGDLDDDNKLIWRQAKSR